MKIKALDRQSLADIAVQTAGSVEAIETLAFEVGVSPTDAVEVGTELKTPAMVNRQVAVYYTNRRLTPATWTGDADDTSAGIGSMIIEQNFIVS
jgi:hypothetical protein